MSNLISVVFFGFYSRFSFLLKTVPYISKSFRNGASTMFFAKTVDGFSRLFHYFRKKAPFHWVLNTPLEISTEIYQKTLVLILFLKLKED